jgi:hypothetical protein
MQPLDTIERRMAALFLLLIGLIVWQAPRTKPLGLPPYVSVLGPGEQVYPIAVPAGAPLESPADPAARLALLRQHAVVAGAPPPAGACEAFLRMSGHHWIRFAAPPGPRVRHLADPRWLAGDPTASPELRPEGPGPEVEVFCP